MTWPDLRFGSNVQQSRKSHRLLARRIGSESSNGFASLRITRIERLGPVEEILYLEGDNPHRSHPSLVASHSEARPASQIALYRNLSCRSALQAALDEAGKEGGEGRDILSGARRFERTHILDAALHRDHRPWIAARAQHKVH